MEPGETLDEIVWDCVWMDIRCASCEHYHKLHKGRFPPKCPYRKYQKWRALYNNDKQLEYILYLKESTRGLTD